MHDRSSDVRKARRIVTTNGPDSRSRVLLVEEVDEHSLVWETRRADPLGREPAAGANDLDPGDCQMRAAYVTIPPDAVLEEHLRRGIPGHDEAGFHRTGTLDFVVLLEGRLRLVLDEEIVELAPGDVVVQRDTNHAWRAGERAARMFVVLCGPAVPAGSRPSKGSSRT